MSDIKRFGWGDEPEDDIIVHPRAGAGVHAHVHEKIDPHKASHKRKLIKKLFHGEKALYDEYVAHFDKAVEQGSKIPHDRAMIAFRKSWQKSAGKWVRKVRI